MAKNLKFNIKNTQLAQALNLEKIKSKLPKKDSKQEEEIPSGQPSTPAEMQAVPDEEPRKARARTKAAPVKTESPETAPIEALPDSSENIEEEKPKRVARNKSSPFEQETSNIETAQPEEEKEEEYNVEEMPHAFEETSKSPEIIPQENLSFVEEHAPPQASQDLPSSSKLTSTSSDLPPSDEKKSKEQSPKPMATHTKAETPAPHTISKSNVTSYPPATQRTITSEARVKLGPTGRHVKDLLRPKVEESVYSEGKKGPPIARKQGEAIIADAQNKQPAKETDKTSEKKIFKAEDDAEAKKGKAKEFQDVKPLKKTSGIRSFDSRDRLGLREDGEENWRKRKPSKHSRIMQEDVTIRPTSLKVRLPISVKDLASEMKLKSSQLVAKMFMQGVVLTLNDFLSDETTVQLLGQEFGCTIEIDTAEEERIRITDKTIQEEIKQSNPEELRTRAPVVAFMGHVDHGKTSLIDAIRKSNRVAGEAGAITQHIGAFRCKTAVGDITILDTPGHEAFSAMRARGAEVTDIVVLVIAGDEGIRQQTIEALQQAKAANVTIVVAINKSDKHGFNAENVYQQLSSHELLPEAWGGSTITVNCSAATGEGITQLLEMLALQAEILELKANPSARARGTVLESEMHKGLGSVATVLIQNGTLRIGDAIVFDQLWGRVKTMRDERGSDNLKEAGPSTPVEITGLSGLPEAGQEFIVVKNEKEARDIAEARMQEMRELSLQQKKKVSLENLVQQAAATQKKILTIVLRADVQGSVEALKASIMNIKTSKVDVNIISAGVGEISESDVQLAAASQAIVIGFHTQIESHAENLIKQTGVKVYEHNIIYHAIDDVKKIMLDLLDKIPQEREMGAANVITTFKSSLIGTIAGCQVSEGVVARNHKARLIRNGEQIWRGNIASLKRIKEDVREVKKGFECGIVLDNFSDYLPGDLIQTYEIYYLTQEL